MDLGVESDLETVFADNDVVFRANVSPLNGR